MSKSKRIRINKNFFIGGCIILFLVLLIVLSSFIDLNLGKASGNVVATVNGEKIVESEVEQLKQSAGSQGQQLDNESALEQVINQKLIFQEAKENYLVTKEEAESLIEEQISKQGSTLEEFKQQLESQGNSYSQVLQSYAEQITIQNYVEAELNISQVNDTQAREFYEQNKEQLFASAEEIPSFEEVGEQIKSYLQSQAQSQELSKLVEDLRAKADISYS